jgi:hypothetical protein
MDLAGVQFKCKCWIQMIRTVLFLVAFDAVWTCREIKMFQRNTLSPSSMYFCSEHWDIIFLPIDDIGLQAHSVNTQNNNTVVFTAARTPSVTVYNYYFSRNKFCSKFGSLWRWRDTVLKCYFCFNLLNCLVAIKITFRKLVLFTSSVESRAQTNSFWPPDWVTVKSGPGGRTSTYDFSKTLTMFEVQRKLTELLSR